jgi:ribonuclease VapC
MILDSSALVAILRGEPEQAEFTRAVVEQAPSRISAASYFESGIQVDKKDDPIRGHRLDEYILRARIEVVPVSANQARIARQAYRDFGKGTGHPAQLNFGDCFAYALAKEAGEPLLFKGGDFVHTDVTPALPR